MQPTVIYALSATLQGQSDEVPTYADLGTTDHFFVDRNAFSDYKELPNPIKGHAAPKGAMFHMIGQGTVRKVCKTTQGSSELVF